MISYTNILIILICHFVFDFIFQTDAMAKGKSTSNKCLIQHVGVYSLGLCLMALTLNTSLKFWYLVLWVVINTILHFATDYVTSRINSYLWKKQDVHNFFVGVGADQMIHYATLIGTLLLIPYLI